jgi:FkbM family methyltransferase
MKERIKKFLKKKNVYYHLKYSGVFRLYQAIFKPTEVKRHRAEISFYKSFLPPCDLIFDIGAYDGHKTAAFLALSQRVVCCEPDEENFKVLKIRFRNKKSRVIIENKAVSDKDGEARLHIHHDASAFNTLSDRWVELLENDNKEKWDEKIRFVQTKTVTTTTLDHLIDKYGVPDFIKIDVEGFEQWVLKGLSHLISCLSFETLLPEYSGELQRCLSYVDQLCSAATYNIALHEKLLLDKFVNKPGLDKWLADQKPALSFEIVAKMMNDKSSVNKA